MSEKMPDCNGKNLGIKEKYKIGKPGSTVKEVTTLLSKRISIAIIRCIVTFGRCTREDFAGMGSAEEVESVLTALTEFGFIRTRKDTVILAKEIGEN